MTTPGARPSSSATAQTKAGNLSEKAYAFLQKYIHAETGLVVDGDKRYLLESRLLPIIRDHKIDSLETLSSMLSSKSSGHLAKLVHEAMTTNETLFFRDSVLFDALRTHVLPSMFDGIRGKRKLRIWSAAASSGQEAYSLAMVLLEMGKTKAEVEIVGTDLSSQVLERAQQGSYVQFEVNRGLPSSLLTKCFTKAGTEWKLKDAVRALAQFEQLDLRRDFRHLGSFDLVLCRNVLIYFDTETKKNILTRMRDLLLPGGLLALGCAETMINVHDGFQRLSLNQSTFYAPR